MEKLNLKKGNVYTIEVNENGDTIEFNLDDIELPLKLEKMMETLKKLNDRMHAQNIIIDKQQDEERDGILSKNELERAKVIYNTFQETRNAFDLFLGEGACDKIFGNVNYATMWDDLLEALEPHFEKMKLKREKMVDVIKKKYEVNNDEELS